MLLNAGGRRGEGNWPECWLTHNVFAPAAVLVLSLM